MGFGPAPVTWTSCGLAAAAGTQAKRAGKQRLELKNYVVQDFDVMNFRFNKT